MYTFKAATRLYLIEWIRIIDSVPGLDLINYLPEFLDQLVRFLSDPKEDVRLKAGSALAELLREVEECAGVQELIEEDNREEGRQVEGSNDGGEANVNRPIDFATDELRKAVRRKKIRDGRRELGAIEPMKVSKSKAGEDRMKGRGVKVDYERCLAILIVHLQSNDQEILVTALRWVSSFGYICPHQLVGKTPELVHALLPLQSHSNSGIRTMAKRTNHRLQALVWVQQDGPQAQEGQSAFKASDGNGAGSNKGSDDKVKAQTKDEQPSFNYEKVFTVVELLFANNAHETTKIECMVWLLLLHKKRPEKILTNSRSGFQFLLRVLNDPSDHVAKLDLRLFAQIALHLEQQQNKQPSLMFLIDLVYNLLLLDESNTNDITNVKGKGSSDNNRNKVNSVYALEFSENSADFQNSRFSLIVRQLCIVLPPEKVYRVFSAVLRCKLDSLLPHLSSYNKVETGKDGGIYRELHKTIDSENIVSGNHILSFETPNIPSDSNLAPYILLIRHLTLILACAPETLSLRLLLQPNTNNPTSKGSNISSTQPPSIATLARNSASPVSLFSNFSRKSPNLYGPFDISPSVPTGFLDFNLTLGNTNDLDGFKKRSLAMVYSNSFFESLFCGFIADPFSLLTICFLSNNFKLSHHIINKTISSGYSNNSDFLAQLDILVTLIESPSFAFLRLLLVSNLNTFLLESLFGILMLLPQSPAFATLRNRLSVVSLLPKTDPNSGTNISNSDSQLRLSSLFDHVVDSLLNM
ncbi:Protein VAC14-like protein [Zancudomyces culisetae]|uniref:Protein VAC14-like protein n=1 Tax=Zancudomyces culisetae TaxID=1213189 RepID=A0A1R1PMN2_ZANCU|nr:Protein VAC14-like protein [Zancudomyces culisetae]|eukprot:OMH82208.1 Protein VAC14-like protein [Zancudomyces culisetae]